MYVKLGMDTEEEDTAAALLKLLEDAEEPRRFCLHKAVQGSEHQCTPQQTSSMPQTNTILVDSTPIQLKKVLSPHNLEMDSDTSSVAAWSFSMATPTTAAPQGGVDQAGGGCCSHANLSLVSVATTTTTDEDSILVSEDEDGISSADESILRLLGNRKLDRCKTVLKMKDNVLMKNKSVARALFPAKEDVSKKANSLKSQQQTPATTAKCASFDPCRLFSPISSIISPLVHHQQHAKVTDRTPSKGESDQSIASGSLFETPGKGKPVREDGDATSCSQELFGSPEIFTPAQISHKSEHDTHTDDHVANENSSPNECTSQNHEQNRTSTSELNFKEEVVDVQHSQCSEAINWEQQTPLLVKRFSCEPHLLPHSTPLCSLPQPGPTRNVSSHNPLIPYSSTQPQGSVLTTPLNTPLCSTAQPQSSHQPLQVTNQTPNIPSMVAKEPSTITPSEQPLAIGSTAMQVNSKTPTHEKKPNEQNYSFGSVGDVMDLLFMSSSQLDTHLSAHKIATECEPTRTTVSELVPKQTLSVSRDPSSYMGENETCKTITKQKSDGVSLATLDTEEDLKSNCAIINAKDVQLTTEEQGTASTKRILSDLKAKAFHYPTKQKSNLKRKKSNIRTREYSMVQKSLEKTDATKNEDEEPLAKRPRTHYQDSDHGGCNTVGDQTCEADDLIKIEESMIVVDHLNKKSPPNGAEMDIDITKKQAYFEQHDHLEEKASHCSCSTDIPSEESRRQSEDIRVTEVMEKGNTVPLSSGNTAMACMSIRAPGLRRTNKKSKVSVAFYPSPRELKCEAEVPNATESVAEAIQCPAAGDPPKQELLTSTTTTKTSVSKDSKVSPFLGFQTAAGSSITVSEQGMKVAHQLIGAESELEEGHPNKSPETPKLIPPRLSTTTTVTSASIRTPSLLIQETNRNPIAATSASFASASPLLPESLGNSQSSAATFPRRPCRRPAKTFKAPRKASDVSSAEEQASVARILRSFRASGAATDPALHKSTRSRIHKQSIETGFQTAGGSSVKVSSEAMEKAQKLVAEDKENGISTDTGSPLLNSSRKRHLSIGTGFETASGSKLTVSGEAMKNAVKLVAKDTKIASTVTDSPLLISNGTKERVATGFKTASGSRLMVSNEAMNMAQELIDKNENGISADANSSPRKEQVVTGFKTGSGKELRTSASAITQAAVKFEEGASTPTTSHFVHNNDITVGFQMASGKRLSVSALSMQKAESLLSSELGLDTVNTDSCNFVSTGFRTAGGSGISVSSKSLKCAEELMEKEDNYLQQFDDVKISLFQSPHREETRERVLTGFSTAGGTSISVSRTSLEECEKLIETGECEVSLNAGNSVTVAAVELGGSPCSLTAEDIETFSTFTQMKFERQTPDKNDLPSHSAMEIIHPPSDSTTHSEKLDTECNIDEDAEPSGNESDDHSCFFSTQVVKQLTDFSSEEEMSCDEESNSVAAPQVTDKQASCHADTVDNNDDGLGADQFVEAQEEHGENVHVRVQSQTQRINEIEYHQDDDSLSRGQNDSVVAQHADAEVVDLLSESLLLREFHDAETRDHPSIDESALEVNLSGVLSEGMIENMDISINMLTPQLNSQEEVTATKVCVVNARSGSHRNNETAPEMLHVETPLQHLPSRSQPSHPDPSQSSLPHPSPSGPQPSLSGHSQPSLPDPQPSLPGPSQSSESLPEHSQPSLPGPSHSSLPGHSQRSLSGLPKSCVSSPFQPSLPGPQQLSTSAIFQFPGLQTASGKQVHIPENALKVAKQVLGSNSSDPMLPSVHDDRPIYSSSLLQTASGTPVHISEASLRAVRGILADGSEAGCTPNDPSSPQRGFEHIDVQTASGKKMEVSENTLLSVKEKQGSASDITLLSNTVNSATPCEPPQPHPISFMTAGGREVQVPEEALAAVRSSSSGTACTNTDLQTASGNKVEIPEESMRAAKHLLNSDPSSGRSACSFSTSSEFPGLSTASGTKVTISQKALEAARATLDGKTPPPRTPSHSGSFSGLTTASGSKVTIPADSLQAARAVLGSTSTLNNRCDDIPSEATTSAFRKDSFTQKSSKSQTFISPVTTQPSSLPGAPTRKYKPIFRSGGARNERGHTSFSSGMSDATTTPLASAHARVEQQLPIQSRAGVISTPEGTLYDRRQPPGRRPLLPKQSHLDGDGAYVVINNDGSSLPSSSRTRPQPAQSHPKGSSSSSVIFKTPHRSMASSSHFHTQSSSFNQSSGLSNQASSVSNPSLFSTPRRSVVPHPSYYQRSSFSSHRPAWKGAERASERGALSASVTPTAPLNQSSRQATDSCSSSNIAAQYVVSQTSKQLPSTPNCLQTSTQLTDVSDKSTFDTPLSPLQITLSQICAMEDSQVLGIREDTTTVISTATELTCDESATKGSTAAAGVEDSGYASREVSTVQTPSPYAKDKVDPSHSVGKMCDELEPEKNKVERKSSIDEDTLLAEAELEGLNDSLEELDNEDDVHVHVSVGPASQKQPREQASNHQQSIRHPSSPPIHVRPTASTSSCRNGVVKPQMGSLLSARLNDTRIPLEHAVGHQPPGGFTLSQLHSLGVSGDTVLVRASNPANFSFSGAQYFSSSVLSGSPACIGDGAMLKLSPKGRAGVLEFWEAFRGLPCVDEKLISYEWFVNHYRQLVWKLASMEVCYPHRFGGRCLTPDWLMLQLKYRYDREIDRAERSALHKICENDDVPSRRMVLCVSQVYGENLMSASSTAGNISEGIAAKVSTDMETGNETIVQSETTKESKSDTTEKNLPCIELTDGWYSLPCALDPPLKQMVKRGKITVGTKLLTYGAELVGQSNPSHPLEMSPGCYLKISANSTRRARWFAKLGYQAMPCSFPVPLLSVFPDGGLVGCTDVVIARVYPMAYLEKREEKKSVLRSERMEQKIAALHEAERQRKIDTICSKVQKEFEEEVAKQDCPAVSRRRSRRLNTLQIKQLHDGEEIYNALNNAPDPQAFQEILSQTQMILLESYRQSLMSMRQEELQSRIRDAVKEAEEQLPPDRKVIPLLRMRIIPSMTSDSVPRLQGDVSSASDCHLSIWRPTDELRQLLKEGCPFRVTNLTAYPSRFKHLQVTATRSSHYQPLKSQEPSSFYSPREVTPIARLAGLSVDQLAYRELDTVGIAVCTVSDHVMSHDPEGAERLVDSVFVADSEGCLMVIRVWDGLKSQDLEETTKPGSVLALSNLSYRGLGHTHNLPTCNAGDCAVFSQKPRDQHLKDALADLNKNLPSRKNRLKFLQTLEDEISSYL